MESREIVYKQDAIDAVIKHLQLDYEYAWGVREAINGLPSAEQEPIKLHVHALTEEEIKNLKQKIGDSSIVFIPSAERKGKWILHQDSRSWECSECHKYQVCYSDYCMHCGAAMREVEYESKE